MSAEETLHARRQLLRLQTQPLNALSANVISVASFPGNDTQSVPLYFGSVSNEMRIGPSNQSAQVFPFLGRSDADAVVRCTGLVSPMRDHIANDIDRLNPTIKVQPGANKLWVTDQQTGCSVLILKWAGGFYSMVHLRPNDDSEFNALTALINRSDLGMALQKNAWLKPQLTLIAELSGNGVNPEAYILIQSLHTARIGACQVIGVNVNGVFEFYLQKLVSVGASLRVTAQQMQWTPWRDYVPYFSY